MWYNRGKVLGVGAEFGSWIESWGGVRKLDRELGRRGRRGRDHKLRSKIERMEDTRNLVDEFKGLKNEEVFERLSERRTGLEVAIENVEHDFNIGTIVRNANSFNVSKVHIIGKKKYNRRGAMCTDKYLEICYWGGVGEFLEDQRARGREVVAIENNTPRALPLNERGFKGKEVTLVFGSEGAGISEELLTGAEDVRYIESFGSTRSVNVGVASGIAMYKWAQDNIL